MLYFLTPLGKILVACNVAEFLFDCDPCGVGDFGNDAPVGSGVAEIFFEHDASGISQATLKVMSQ